jgi:UDPglucose--hexose-1-phosphate uridylyltransferase
LTNDGKRIYNRGMERLPRHGLRHSDGRSLYVYGAYDGSELPADSAPGEWPALHLRHDALTDRWIGVSPARNARPQSHGAAPAAVTPTCPLCIGGPELPFPYEAAVFENRFPTLLADPPAPPTLEWATAPSQGACEVVLYTSTHTGSLATLTARELARVVAIWTDRSQALWSDPGNRYVLIFENRGEDVGATLSHPHGQIYALGHLPSLAHDRLRALTTYRDQHDTCLTCDVVARDLAATQRVLLTNDSFVVGVPFAPNWPFEIHVRARRHGARRLTDLDTAERRDLAAALRDVVTRYDQLYERPLAYLMACHEAPSDVDGAPASDWHLAFEFLPPNRGPDRLKVRATVETAAGFFINDTVPEASAAQLAEVSTSTDGAAEPIPDVVVVPAETLAVDGAR